MGELQVVEMNKTITSLEIAEMTGKRHGHVLRDIRNYVEQMKVITQPNFGFSDYFTPNSYVDDSGKENECFNVTRKGCEFYANKMTGQKGTEFTVKYIERFHQMEESLKTPQSNTKLLLRAALEQQEKIEALETKTSTLESEVTTLSESMRISGAQELEINTLGKRRVVQTLGGKDGYVYQKHSSKMFRRFWTEFNRYFMIPRYSELPKSKFDEAKAFIQEWQPPTEVRMQLKDLQNQLNLFGGENDAQG